MVQRPLYLARIAPFIDKPLVKILTGIKRSGKSTLLALIRDEILARGVSDANMIFIQLDSLKANINNSQQLYDRVVQLIGENKEKCYLFIDEIQEVEGWEKAINSLLSDKNIDIYLASSNSKLISSKIATYLTGRYVIIPVYPLSYREYLAFQKEYNQITDDQDLVANYLRIGGFPTVSKGHYEEGEADTIVKDIYNSLILTDIVQRNKVRNIDLFERVVNFIFENVGKSFSANAIANHLKNEHRSLSVETIYNYLDLLKNADVIYKAPRYDIKAKAVLETQEKYYLADPSLNYALWGYQPILVDAMMENIVYLEMKRRGYEVYIGKLNSREINFMGLDKDKKVYVQVCRNFPTESGRKLENLLAVDDNYPKYIVTLDKLATGNEEGIPIVYLANFLLMDNW